jgi:hypothetical protein
MHSINQPRHIVRKSSCVVKTAEDRKLLKTALDTFGAGALCCDGITTPGEIQRLLSDGAATISENSRKSLGKGHYNDGSNSVQKFMKMHTDGSGEPPIYSLARSMMKRGYLPDEITKMLKISRAELSKALVPASLG